MNTDKHEFSDSLTEQVLAAVFEVSNTLGAGFLEKVYERALLRELGLRGLRTTAQAAFVVKYKGFAVGEYYADILVEYSTAIVTPPGSDTAPPRAPPASRRAERSRWAPAR
jgi:hypothetical protein